MVIFYNTWNICRFWDCVSDAKKIIKGDDGKDINLCSTHYRIVKKAMDSRFK